MAELPFSPIITATATATPKEPGANQDRGAAITLPGGGGAALVCDGIGSFERSGEVAAEVIGLAVPLLEAEGAAGVPGLPRLIDEKLDQDPDRGGTTLIAAAMESSGRLSFAYVGNGALLEIRARDAAVGSCRAALVFTDLALPHISFELGKPALTSFLPSLDGGPRTVSGLVEDQGADAAKLVLAVSDGISTDEDRPLGRAPAGGAWKAVPEPLLAVLEGIGEVWGILATASSPDEVLREALSGVLEGLLAREVLEDDATASAVMWRPAPLREEG